MNLKKCFIGVILVGVLSLVIQVPSKAMFSSARIPFLIEESGNPITYDEAGESYIPDQQYTRVDPYTGCNTGNVWVMGSGMSPAKRKSVGKRLYALALEKKGDSEKFECLKKAAYHGNIDALIATGHCYEEGKGVSKNLKMALIYYKMAKENGAVSVQSDIDRVEKIIRT